MASSIARWNGIQWVIVSDTDDINSKLVLPPAEAGPRDDIPAQARFGHTGTHGSVGFMALDNGQNHIVTANAQFVSFFQRDAAGTGFDPLASLSTAGLDVGPAKMSIRSDVPVANEARFGHVTQHGSVGFISLPAGSNQVISAYNEALRFYQRNSSGVGHDLVGYTHAAKSVLNGWALAQSHPVHGGSYAAIWRDGSDGGDRYTLLTTVSETMLNGLSSVYLRVSNSSVLSANSGSLSVHVPFYTGGLNANGLVQSNGDGTNTFYGNAGRGKIHSLNPVWADDSRNSGAWYEAIILAQSQIQYGFGCRIAVHTYGAGAPQWRVTNWSGEAWEAVSSGADAWANVHCLDAVEYSARVGKKEIRTLRPEREYVGLHRDPEADTVETPDIMALRPVAFRRKKPMVRPVRVDPDGDPADEKSWRTEEYPPGTVHGRESRRERLGLIADEVQHVIPSAVYHGDTGEVSGINWSQVTVALLDHVQELTHTVETLQYRIVELERGEP